MRIPDILLYAIPFAIGSIVIEWAIIFFVNKEKVDVRGSISSIILGGVKMLISLSTKSTTVIVYYLIYDKYRIFTLEPSLIIWLISFITTDLSYYWYHRASHRIRWFWASHMTHHSSHEFNLLVGIRHGWTSNFTGAMFFYLWLPFIGFSPPVIFISMQVNFLYTYCVHTELIRKLWRPIEYIFVTPSHHRVHHGSNHHYLNANYGEVLIIWDRLFGTFVEENQRPKYGLVTPIKSYNPIKLALNEWVEMVKDVSKSRSLKNIFMYLFAPPEWSENNRHNLEEEVKN